VTGAGELDLGYRLTASGVIKTGVLHTMERTGEVLKHPIRRRTSMEAG